MKKVLWFIMKNIRKIVSYLQSVILLLIGITTAINMINCIYIKKQFVLLEENQLLYIYSSLAQVIGAILGLTIASYSMIDSKMKVYGENDDTVEEYIDEGRRECYRCFLFIIVFLILQQIEGNLIYPHVVGGSVGLPSIWVLAAVTIGGNLMGIVGMLVFIPLLSVFYTIFREFVYLHLKKQHIKRVTTTEIEKYTEEDHPIQADNQRED